MSAKFDLAQIKEHAPALVAGALILLLSFVAPRFLHGGHHAPSASADDARSARYYQECVTGVLQTSRVPPSCASRDKITNTYQIDPQVLLAAAQGSLILTARRIARGDFADEKSYDQCVADNKCARLTIPKRAAAGDTPQGQAERAEFWHLVNDGSITAGSCSLLDICQAQIKAGLIKAPPTLPAMTQSAIKQTVTPNKPTARP